MSSPTPVAGIGDTNPHTRLKIEVRKRQRKKRTGHFELFSDGHPKRTRTKLMFQISESEGMDEDTQEGAAEEESKRDMPKDLATDAEKQYGVCTEL